MKLYIFQLGQDGRFDQHEVTFVRETKVSVVVDCGPSRFRKTNERSFKKSMLLKHQWLSMKECFEKGHILEETKNGIFHLSDKP